MKLLFTIPFVLLLGSYSFAHDYQKIDEYAKNAPERVTKNVESLTAYLVKPARNEREKVRSFFIWIAENIDYDVQAFQAFDPYKASKITANDVLKKRKAVCQGYSELFKEMCLLSGIKCYVVPGYSKGFGYQPGNKTFTRADHAWNAVYVDGQWQLIDATWGSGGVDQHLKYIKQLKEAYFLSDPREFVRDHLPQQPAWQLLDCPVSMKAYVTGEEAIAQELSRSNGQCKNYHEVIAQWEAMSGEERALQSAASAYAFNPANHVVMARGWMDYANALMNGIKRELHSRKEIEEAVALQEKALNYLKKAEALLKKVKDNSADMEKQVLQRNIQVSEQNLKSMREILKG